MLGEFSNGIMCSYAFYEVVCQHVSPQFLPNKSSKRRNDYASSWTNSRFMFHEALTIYGYHPPISNPVHFN